MSESLTGQTWPTEERIINRMQQHIDEALGLGTWQAITLSGAPRPDMDNIELSRTTGKMVAGFDKLAGDAIGNRVFSGVRHGLSAEDFAWAREKFLQYNSIDAFAAALLEDQLAELAQHLQTGALFYGQPITAEVFEYASRIDDLFYGRRTGNQIYATAIPYRAAEYLREQDPVKKRYCMCHCQFARESILRDATVSKTMCYCSLGHNLMFWETVLDTELSGDVVASALGGDDTCKFVITLPEAVMERYVRGAP